MRIRALSSGTPTRGASYSDRAITRCRACYRVAADGDGRPRLSTATEAKGSSNLAHLRDAFGGPGGEGRTEGDADFDEAAGGTDGLRRPGERADEMASAQVDPPARSAWSCCQLVWWATIRPAVLRPAVFGPPVRPLCQNLPVRGPFSGAALIGHPHPSCRTCEEIIRGISSEPRAK